MGLSLGMRERTARICCARLLDSVARQGHRRDAHATRAARLRGAPPGLPFTPSMAVFARNDGRQWLGAPRYAFWSSTTIPCQSPL